MDKEDIVSMFQEHLINYSICLTGSIKRKNYDEVFNYIRICEAFASNLKYIQEQENLNNGN